MMKKASDNPPPEQISKNDLLFALRNYPGRKFVGQDMRAKANEQYGEPQPWPRHTGEKTTKPTFKGKR